MAANSSRRAVAGLGKRLLSHNISCFAPSLCVSAPSLRRSMHGSVYDKNIDDQVCPVVVPDDIIASQSEKYWAPNPQTGVFGPPSTGNAGGSGEGGFYTSPLHGDHDSESVLEQKAFFRPVEDLDLPELP